MKQIEQQIMSTIILDLIHEGFVVEIENNHGEGDLMVHTKSEDGERQGWVKLVEGNGCSLISDYSSDLEAHIQGAIKLSDLLDEIQNL